MAMMQQTLAGSAAPGSAEELQLLGNSFQMDAAAQHEHGMTGGLSQPLSGLPPPGMAGLRQHSNPKFKTEMSSDRNHFSSAPLF